MTSTSDTPADMSLREQFSSPLGATHEPDEAAVRDERWALVSGFSGKYSVSSLGRVLRHPSFATRDVRLWEPLLLVPTFSGGYFRVFLRGGKRRQQYRLDRLMLCAFADQPLAVFDVAYRNGDRSDLRLENLERLNTITVLGPPGSRRRSIE